MHGQNHIKFDIVEICDSISFMAFVI